jgi:prevent-host-death family protein
VTTREVPLAEAEHRLRELVTAVEQTGDSYIITAAGRPAAVLTSHGKRERGAAPSEESYAHITRVAGIGGGEPIIRGTRISVRHIVACSRAGQTVDEILDGLPHLTPAQVYAALAYYHDHRDEIDALIETAQPERVAAAHGLRITKLGGGIAVVQKKAP